MIYTEIGIINGKTFFSWEDFLQIIKELTNVKMEEKIKEAAQNRVKIDDINFFQEMDKEKLNQMALTLGMSDQSSHALKTIKNNIRRKIEKIQEKK